MPPMEGVFLSPEYYRELTDKADRVPGLERERDEARAEIVRLGKQVERLEADNRTMIMGRFVDTLPVRPRIVKTEGRIEGEHLVMTVTVALEPDPPRRRVPLHVLARR